jgi:hypothetical protein
MSSTDGASKQPAWVTTLIVAAVIAAAGLAGFVMRTPELGWVALIAAGIAALIAAVQALRARLR